VLKFKRKFRRQKVNVWLITNTITGFIGNVRVMTDEYSGTIVQRQPPAAQCHTAVTSHRTRR